MAMVLSVTATAGLMVVMGAANVQSAAATAPPALPQAAPTPVASITRPNILLPVPMTTGGNTLTRSVPRATPQPIVVQPRRRLVVARSNGSR